ncbi:MAG: hypothetical protein NVS2B14_12100 [Chamaesiphon sp.]
MLKTKLIVQIISCGLLSLPFIILSEQLARALGPVFLLYAPCANAGPGNWGENNLNVSIGKAVYRSIFFMGAGDRFASLTCKINPEKSAPIFKSLQLGFGMRDNDSSSPANTINIYLDGKQAISQTIAPGEKQVLSLNIANVKNVAIESICSTQSQYCDRVYFFDATLDQKSPFSNQSK